MAEEATLAHKSPHLNDDFWVRLSRVEADLGEIRTLIDEIEEELNHE